MSKITVKVNDIEDKVGQLESKVRQIENSRDFDTGINRRCKHEHDVTRNS